LPDRLALLGVIPLNVLELAELPQIETIRLDQCQ
jgi:hypothetical protein